MKYIVALLLVAVGSQISITNAGSTKGLLLSVDDRMVDGALVEYRLIKDPSTGLFALTKTETFIDRAAAKEKTIGPDLIQGELECSIARKKAYCSHDARPVDGALYEYTTVAEGGGTYSLQHTITYVDRRTGKEVSNTAVIAEGLKFFRK